VEPLFLTLEEILAIHENRNPQVPWIVGCTRFEVHAAEEDLYDLVIGVAEGRVSKAAVAVFLEKHAG
jgi:hypothetical protein